MSHPPQHTSQQQSVDVDWELVLRFLPSGWEEQSKTLGAFARARKIKSPGELLRVVLMHAGVGLSLQRTAEVAGHAEGMRVSKVSIWERVRKAGPWLSWLVEQMLATRVECPSIAGYRARCVDASTVTGPKAGVQLRLHYCIGLTHLSCDGLVVTDTHEAESLKHFEVVPGDLLIGDRIYAKAAGVAHVKRSDGDVIVRLGCTSMTLYDETGAKIDRLAWLRTVAPGEAGERFAQFRDEDGQWVTGRICAVRLSAAQAKKARERQRNRARRTGQKLRDNTLEHAGYVCLFTTAKQHRLGAEMVLELYRARWQIELVFKRLKSLLGADQLRDTSLESALIWLHGKMLYALLLYACLDEAGAFSPWGYPLRPGTAEPRASGSDGHQGLAAGRSRQARTGGGRSGPQTPVAAQVA